ncbi:hypothetical protein [Bacteriovorax sp. DB6_IX]|uniref:hypothetical protein n=1 Tax=Bacteriovorax sp. DB6_IX TaxID=1353530 RepID=UPI000389DA41|nr:hypothetical protein [Bacteriovorax sp. DB6_IX]EQC44099.1 hypothetical protein M901_0635 [Bacteriovorax sp. DB6_IX]
MRLIIASFLTVLTLNTFAFEAGSKDVDKMVDALVKTGMIQADKAEMVRKQMKSMTAEDWKKANEMAKKFQANPELLKNAAKK